MKDYSVLENYKGDKIVLDDKNLPIRKFLRGNNPLPINKDALGNDIEEIDIIYSIDNFVDMIEKTNFWKLNSHNYIGGYGFGYNKLINGINRIIHTESPFFKQNEKSIFPHIFFDITFNSDNKKYYNVLVVSDDFYHFLSDNINNNSINSIETIFNKNSKNMKTISLPKYIEYLLFLYKFKVYNLISIPLSANDKVRNLFILFDEKEVMRFLENNTKYKHQIIDMINNDLFINFNIDEIKKNNAFFKWVFFNSKKYINNLIEKYNVNINEYKSKDIILKLEEIKKELFGIDPYLLYKNVNSYIKLFLQIILKQEKINYDLIWKIQEKLIDNIGFDGNINTFMLLNFTKQLIQEEIKLDILKLIEKNKTPTNIFLEKDFKLKIGNKKVKVKLEFEFAGENYKLKFKDSVKNLSDLINNLTEEIVELVDLDGYYKKFEIENLDNDKQLFI